MDSALKLLSSKPATPARPARPVEAVVKTPLPPVDPVVDAPSASPNAANDALMGLVSGSAPDPTAEIPIEAEAVTTEAIPEGEEEGPFRKLKFTSQTSDTGSRYLDVNSETGEITVSNMGEEEFIEFWSVDAWEMLSGLAGMFRIDISEIETEDHEREQGRTAAKRLYRLAQKHPRWLGWMLSESTLNGGDMLVCVAFFGGKAGALFGAWRDRKEKKQQPPVGQVKPVETTSD